MLLLTVIECCKNTVTSHTVTGVYRLCSDSW